MIRESVSIVTTRFAASCPMACFNLLYDDCYHVEICCCSGWAIAARSGTLQEGQGQEGCRRRGSQGLRVYFHRELKTWLVLDRRRLRVHFGTSVCAGFCSPASWQHVVLWPACVCMHDDSQCVYIWRVCVCVSH